MNPPYLPPPPPPSGSNGYPLQLMQQPNGPIMPGQQPQQQQPDPGSQLGYGGLAAFMDMDDDFMLFRRFGALSVRSLLYMQDEIVNLEAQLKALDEIQRQKGIDLGQRSFDSAEKIQVMERLRALLKEYAECLELFGNVRKHKPASGRQKKSLTNWMEGNHPLTDEEQAWIYKRDDLIVMSTYEKSLLDRFVGRQPWLIRLLFNKTKNFPQEIPIENRRELAFFSDRSVERTVKWIVVILSLIFLIIPMLVLQLALQDKSAGAQAGFTASFIIIFAFFMSAFTLARPAEILAATAGYSAVLVVFMNQTQPYFGTQGQKAPS